MDTSIIKSQKRIVSDGQKWLNCDFFWETLGQRSQLKDISSQFASVMEKNTLLSNYIFTLKIFVSDGQFWRTNIFSKFVFTYLLLMHWNYKNRISSTKY